MIICLNGLHVSMYGCAYIHIHTCARMCEKNIRLSVHVYMKMGVFITICLCVCIYVYMCESVYVNTCNIWMMLVC